MYLIKLFFALVVAFLFSATITSIFILFQNTIWNIFWLKTQGFDISFFILIQIGRTNLIKIKKDARLFCNYFIQSLI